jgi:hypothetical protein
MLSDLNNCKVIYSTPLSSGQCQFGGSVELLLAKNTKTRGFTGGYSCNLSGSSLIEKVVGTFATLLATSVPSLDELCDGLKVFPATYDGSVQTEFKITSNEVYVINSTATIKIEAAFNPLP